MQALKPSMAGCSASWPKELYRGGGNPSHVALVRAMHFGPRDLGPMAKTSFFNLNF